MIVSYILKFAFWANLLDFGQRGVSSQRWRESLGAFRANFVVVQPAGYKQEGSGRLCAIVAKSGKFDFLGKLTTNWSARR